MSGHIFIVHGDLTKLACDSWLLPCDHVRNVMPHWHEEIMSPDWEATEPTDAWLARKVRAERVTNSAPNCPPPWLVDTGGIHDTKITWYADGVDEFVREASPYARRTPFLRNRAKPLLAIPLVGAGAGGGAARAGQLVTEILPRLDQGAVREDVDIAIVLNDECSYAAAIHARLRYAESGKECWPDLTPALKGQAETLAKLALQGRLVLFVGAGVSQSANLPGWKGLLKDLATGVGIVSTDERSMKCFHDLNVLDQARVIEMQLERSARVTDSDETTAPIVNSIGTEVSRIIASRQHVSIGHALLAGLPVNEVVTTNYDTLFETAASAARRPVAVLPYERPQDHGRWLLKMHGCVRRPEDIVLTRGDFIRYDDRRAALRGIVQAMLITKHMLFVGFSLEDDNFQRIAEDVRKAIRGSKSTDTVKFGTALTIDDNPLFRNLWSQDLSWVTFASGAATMSDESRANAARQQEVFLDYLAAHASATSRHLMDFRFDGVLSDAERQLRSAVLELLKNVPEDCRKTIAWHELEQAFVRLGHLRE